MDAVIRDGLIAIQHHSSNPWSVKIEEDIYYFIPQHNVSLAMVKLEHVDRVLSVTRKACCGTNPRRFHLASLINYNLWKTGNRHGEIENGTL